MKNESSRINNLKQRNNKKNHLGINHSKSLISQKLGISFKHNLPKYQIQNENKINDLNSFKLKMIKSKKHNLPLNNSLELSRNKNLKFRNQNHNFINAKIANTNFLRTSSTNNRLIKSKNLYDNYLIPDKAMNFQFAKKNINKNESYEPSVEIADISTSKYKYEEKKRDIRELLDNLKIKTNNISLYEEALTHNSYSNETSFAHNYQRLEFLGDSIINKIVSTFLYEMSEDDEGKMTKDRISIIQAKTLVRASIELNLHKYISVGQGLIKNTISEKILEDIFESFIGAVYLDKGEIKAKELLMRTILKYYLNNDLKNTIDYKTKFQEAVQKHGKNNEIFYRRINSHDHNYFEVELVCNNIIYGRGRGTKLHDAEVAAAKKACEKISKVNN